MLKETNTNSLMRYSTRLCVLAIAFFVFAPNAHAATLRLSPANASAAAGSTFAVSVILSSPDQAVNAVSGEIDFDPSKLELTSLSKSGSIIGLWVQEPSFSNTDGNAHFEGVILNPGYTGSGATVITAKFRAKKEGQYSISLASPQVLANDGSGSDILTGSSGSTVSVTPASSEQTTPTASGSKSSTSKTKSQQQSTGTLPLEAPIIASDTDIIPYGGNIQITGQSKYPSSAVELRIGSLVSDQDFSEETSGALHQSAMTAEDGSFTFTIKNDGKPGGRVVTARVEDTDGNSSAQSNALNIVMQQRPLLPVLMSFAESVGVGFIAASLALLFLLILLFSFWRYRMFKRKMRKELRGVDATLHKALTLLREDMEGFVESLEKEKDKRKLTLLENKFLKQMKQNLVDTEKVVEKALDNAEDILD